MTEKDETKWYQRPFQATVAGGVVAGLSLWGLAQIWDAATAAKLPAWTYVVVGLLLFAGVSAILPASRRAVWVTAPKAILRGFLWLISLRPISGPGRAKLEAKGRAAAMKEVAEARKRAGKPSFHVREDESRSLGVQHRHWLLNRGQPVSDIHVTADEAFFHIDGEIRRHGTLAQDRMFSFEGEATERGATEGVKFHATWVDENGDPDEGTFTFPPEDVQQYRDRALQHEHHKGVVEGRRMEREAAAAAARAAPESVGESKDSDGKA